MAVAEVDYLNGGGGNEPIILATKTSYDTTEFALSDSIANYKYLLLCMETSGTIYKMRSAIVPTSIIDSTYLVDVSVYSESNVSYYCAVEVQFTDNTHAKIYRTWANNFSMASLKIYGIS